MGPLLFLVVFAYGVYGLSCPCNFAQTIEAADPLFVSCMAFWEGKMQSVAFFTDLGLTKDGHYINYKTGSVDGCPQHNFSAPSKESLHLGLLARAIEGKEEAALIFVVSPFCHSNNMTFSECLEFAYDHGTEVATAALQQKMLSLKKWNVAYPGFGGFLPWFTVADGNSVVPMSDWLNRVPSLDNGEMIWGLVACYQALSEDVALKKMVWEYIGLLAQNALTVFYDGNGRFRTVTLIKNVSDIPSPGNYLCPVGGCGYLDDPYEGELFTVFAWLLGNWTGQEGRDQVWVSKV